MLDAVDARKSLLVVAPTSAGKTFVSYYTMKVNRALAAQCFMCSQASNCTFCSYRVLLSDFSRVKPMPAAVQAVLEHNQDKRMKKGDKRRVVFLMPTKALVLQTQGDLYNQYEKYIKEARSKPFASWTRDFRDEGFLDAQILITLPELLESMLVSNVKKDREWISSLTCVPGPKTAPRVAAPFHSLSEPHCLQLF